MIKLGKFTGAMPVEKYWFFLMKTTYGMRLKFLLWFGTLALLTGNSLPAQDFDQLSWKQKVFFGGNFSLMLGTETYIDLSPVAGYRITRRLSAGAGPIYQFYSIKTFGGRYSFHIYGGRAFASYTVINDLNRLIPLGFSTSIFAYTEDEALNMERKLLDVMLPEGSGRFWLNNMLVGGGIGQPVGKRSSFNIMILWSLNETAASLYQNPLVRFGFSF